MQCKGHNKITKENLGYVYNIKVTLNQQNWTLFVHMLKVTTQQTNRTLVAHADATIHKKTDESHDNP